MRAGLFLIFAVLLATSGEPSDFGCDENDGVRCRGRSVDECEEACYDAFGECEKSCFDRCDRCRPDYEECRRDCGRPTFGCQECDNDPYY